MKRILEHVVVVVVVLVGVAMGLGAYAYSGAYNIGADAHHWPVTFDLMQTVRNRSLAAHSKHIQVPNLNDPQLILKGAGQYAAMCTQCHLTPGESNSEQRVGMYPLPPDLAKARVPPQVAFWAIKHGIKMSGMPAWGMAGHDDQTIWSMVAFIERLPGMTPAEYKAIVAKAPPDDDMDMGAHGGHGHSHADHDADPSPMPGMRGTVTASKPVWR